MIDTALRLPASDVEGLLLGRIIAAMPQTFIEPGREFALYPSDTSIDLLTLNLLYHSDFLPTAQNVINELSSETVLIKAWAKCEFCRILDDAESLAALSQLTIWTVDALQKTLLQRQHIFLAYLRIYELPHPIEVPVHLKGHFVPLPHSLKVTEASPVLSDRVFAQRRHQLENLQPPLYPELEKLHAAIAQLSVTNSITEELAQDIKVFLGWSENAPVAQPDSDLAWIRTIAEAGNSSDGQAFEKLVRRSLIKLGFTNSNSNPGASLNPNATGGAGGLDFYCEAPYPVVGECKASKNESVPNSVSAQLIHLGHTHLGSAQFDNSVKLIVAAGPLTNAAQNAAIGNTINVMRPETLQRLVELKAQHKGSVNLLELKPCLQEAPFGEDADAKINRYIDNVWKGINLRSHLVHLVKKHLENTGDESVGVDALHGAYVHFKPPKPLQCEMMHEILLELSSPLTGYLGRIKGSDWRRDRFYFLHDLPTD